LKSSARDKRQSRSSILQVQIRAEAIGNVAVRGTVDRTEESDLIRAAQRGDQQAFEQLVRSYDQQVLRMALNLLHSEEDARDIYQEAFLRVYRNLPRFRFDCSFSTWLYRIVANLCLDQIRRRKVRKEEPAALTTGGGELDRFQFVAEDRADVDPQRQLMSAEVNSRVQEVLSRLTPRERLVFEMRHYQGMRLRSIGEALGVTEEAAKNCLFRATQKMRAALGDLV
jgi:RNA polymerase sigma-70 factor (ECF subfamily)